MRSTLLDIARRYADVNCRRGVAPTPIPGLTILREAAPTALTYAISKPLVALVLQGAKRVTMARSTFDFGAGESLLITADVPTVSEVTRATAGKPYLSLVIDLDPAVVQNLVTHMGAAPSADPMPVRIGPTDVEVEDAASRLLRLLDDPSALSVLREQLLRELHFWLLSGRHGAAIRALGVADSHAQRIARAVAMIRSDYAGTLRVKQLAEAAGMGPSSFHKHFRSITTLTPVQFQKQLRLIEARRMLLADGVRISHAAYDVGYESVAQFTREYGRLFGMPPGRDMKATKAGGRPARDVTGREGQPENRVKANAAA